MAEAKWPVCKEEAKANVHRPWPLASNTADRSLRPGRLPSTSERIAWERARARMGRRGPIPFKGLWLCCVGRSSLGGKKGSHPFLGIDLPPRLARDPSALPPFRKFISAFALNNMALFLDPALTKGLQANWALPLFEPSPISDRISDYLDGAGYFGIQEFDRTIGVDVAHPFPDIQAKEHQFIVDLTLAPDQPTKDYFKEHHTKARAMYTGYLHLWGKTTLDMIGWDTGAIFGAIPDDDIFAFVLTDFYSRFTALGYPTYFPHDVPAIYRAFYVNVDLDNTILTDLISNSMPRKLAEKLIAGYNIGTGNWVDDYLTLFLDHEEPIPVTGNSIIAPLRLHNPAVADQYRLSMFFLDSDFNDVSPELSNCFEYFQRLPHYNEDPVSHLPQMRSIAGHPLIHHATISNLPIEGARVDLLDHTDFTGKLGIGVTSNVAVDWETHPAGLVMQNPPVTPLSGPAAEDIDLTGHGESKFTVYNPDNVNVLVEFDSSGGVDLNGLSLNLVLPGNMPVLGDTSHIVPGDPEFDIVVVRTQAKSTQSQIYINVYQLDATLQNPIFVKRIALQFFDFKVFPVSFWRVNDTTLNLAYDGHDDLAAVIAEMNRALGKQANIFVYATARLNGPTDPVLEVADATEFFHAGTYLGSYPNFETYGSAAQIFNQAIDSQGTLTKPMSSGCPGCPILTLRTRVAVRSIRLVTHLRRTQRRIPLLILIIRSS